MKRLIHWTVIPSLLALMSTPAFAYVGPGAGLSLLGALWGLLIAVVTALIFIAVWPIRRYRRKLRERRQQAEAQDADATTTTEAQSAPPSRESSAKQRQAR